MALDPDAFYAHALEAADAEQRLPLSRMTMWDVAPFDQDGLRVAPLRPPVLPEPPRHGEDPATCRTCTREDGVWTNERWRLTRIGGCGVPLVMMLIPRAHHDMGDLPDDLAAELGVLSAHLDPARGGPPEHLALPRVPRRRRRRPPAHLAVRPAARAGPAVRLVAARVGRPAAGVPRRPRPARRRGGRPGADRELRRAQRLVERVGRIERRQDPLVARAPERTTVRSAGCSAASSTTSTGRRTWSP